MRTSAYARAEGDWYIEPRWAVDALLDVEDFPGQSWDPACGGGNIPTTMKRRGLHCVGSDIADRGFGITGLSFFNATLVADHIVSNPPYALVEPFLTHAFRVARGKVAILARLAFLEGSKRKKTLFEQHPPTRVWISSRRINMPPGGRSDIKSTGGKTAYAWFVWDSQNHGEAPMIGWF